MSWLYRQLMRPVLFTQDAETAHSRALHWLSRASRSEFACDALHSFLGSEKLPVEAFGLQFPNPLGLAAGMDKFAEAVPAWAALGFGFSELGGVTFHAQPGNPSPRLFRAVTDEAIVNRMGFNNPGAETFATQVRGWKTSGRWPKHPVGINLGKSKITALEHAAQDYASSFRLLRDVMDFFVINVSSPNTPGLRQLQDKAALDEILAAVQAENSSPNPKPILVKVAPDLSFEALDEILELTTKRSVAGIVATNTTITRPETEDAAAKAVYAQTGGLSGRPLRARSTEVIRHLFRQTRGRLPIIGVGGIFTAADAWEKIEAGASLLQVYTGLIYEGPNIAGAIVHGLRQRLDASGFPNFRAAVGRTALV